MTEEPKNIENFSAEFLRRLDAKIDRLDQKIDRMDQKVSSDLAVLKETTGRLDIHVGIVKSHMTGFMSAARFLETEVNELRGRVEALEDRLRQPREPV